METPKPMKLGSSLLVPNVQELAKQLLADIPDRYIRTDQERLTYLSGVSMIDQTVPVIDLQKLLSPEPITGESELERLHSACKEWGFFQVYIYIVFNYDFMNSTYDFGESVICFSRIGRLELGC
ncbi:hypothetical protein MKW94_018739 [Papaver nudicaule]|uniref:Non-haem dioxygenase N-terminal domain-containing protein n=1 Tax=Papaver nudicaule TaxID=74823 RepID=A0AA42AX71_PAPNU|nr:hypothetical protein [Papaver nudicaule]